MPFLVGTPVIAGSAVAASTGAAVTAGVAASTFVPATAGLIGNAGVLFGSGAILGPTALFGTASQAASAAGGFFDFSFTAKDLIGGAFSLFAAGAAQQAGNTQATIMQRQAQIDQQRADRERQLAIARADDVRRAGDLELGTLRAHRPGNNLALLAAVEQDISLSFERVRTGGEVTATRLEQSGQINRLRSRAARQTGTARGVALLTEGVKDFLV